VITIKPFTYCTELWLTVHLTLCSSAFHASGSLVVLDASEAVVYSLGTLLFIAGSVWYLPAYEKYEGVAWCFIIGSVFFILGDILNAMQISESEKVFVARNLNLVLLHDWIHHVSGRVGSVTNFVPDRSGSQSR